MLNLALSLKKECNAIQSTNVLHAENECIDWFVCLVRHTWHTWQLGLLNIVFMAWDAMEDSTMQPQHNIGLYEDILDQKYYFLH